jgi:hypothetical protein
MREAFLIPLAAAAFYGLALYMRQRTPTGLAWVLGALLVSLPFSPPAAALLLAALVVVGLFLSGERFHADLLHRRAFWLALAGLALLALAGMYITLRQLAPGNITDPLVLLTWWVRKSAEWQAHLSKRASGWIQKIFYETPAWASVPLLVGYGVAQPFLPAALFDITGAPVWRAVMIWRSVGWTALLPLLVYAPLRAFRKGGDAYSRGLSLVLWMGILTAAFRGGGDQWDNPRYRAVFAGLQLALAAWVLVDQHRRRDPWLRRILVGAALVLAWFVPWYLRRYIHMPWPVSGFFETVVLGLSSALIFVLWDLWKDRKNKPGRV